MAHISLRLVGSVFGGRGRVKRWRDAAAITNLVRGIQILWARKAITGTSSFVDEFNFVDPHRLKAEPNLELNTTAYWMCQQFGVSPLFFSCFHSPKYVVKIGNASLIRIDGGKRVALGEG